MPVELPLSNADAFANAELADTVPGSQEERISRLADYLLSTIAEVLPVDTSSVVQDSNPDRHTDDLISLSGILQQRAIHNADIGRRASRASRTAFRPMGRTKHPTINSEHQSEFTQTVTGNIFDNISGDVLSHNAIYIGSDPKEVQLKAVKKILKSHAAIGVKYHEQEKTFCSEGTRDRILNWIMSWTTIRSPKHRCLWITGRPGSGKTTIAATVAHRLKNKKALAAQFFVNRTVSGTTNPNSIFPSLAIQLAEYDSAAAAIIHNVLQEEPGIADKINLRQADRLLLEPLRSLRQQSVVVIIDALDELNDLSDVPKIFADIAVELPSNVKIVITSRAERNVTINFPRDSFHIDLLTQDSRSDVERFLKMRLESLAESLAWDGWPSPTQFCTLSQHADGLFHWAATACKWVYCCVESEGTAIKDTVLDEVASLGMGDLDDLYMAILRRVLGTNRCYIQYYHQVVGCLIVLREPLNIGSLRELLGIPASKFDVKNFFERMRSILISGTGRINDNTVPQMHKTFFDFVTSCRANPYQIDRQFHHALVAASAFRIMATELRFNIFDFPSSYFKNSDLKPVRKLKHYLPRHLRYCCLSWENHIEQASLVSLTSRDKEALVNEARRFMLDSLLYWLEVLSIAGIVRQCAHRALGCLASWIRLLANETPLLHFIADAIRFVDQFANVISQSLPQIYLSALPFAPATSLVKAQYSSRFHRTLRVIDGGTDFCNSDEVCSAALSHDGRLLMTGYRSGRVAMVDTLTGQPLSLPCQFSHTSSFHSPLFISPLIQAPSPHFPTVSETLGLSGRPFEWFPRDEYRYIAVRSNGIYNFTRVARSIQFRDKNCIEFGSDMLTIRESSVVCSQGYIIIPDCGTAFSVYDANGHLAAGPFVGHSRVVKYASFLPHGKTLISTSADGTIRIWDFEAAARYSPSTPDERAWSFHHEFDSSTLAASTGTWVYDSQGNQLFYAPDPHCNLLRGRWELFCIGRHTNIDFTDFVHGENWVQCFAFDDQNTEENVNVTLPQST